MTVKIFDLVKRNAGVIGKGAALLELNYKQFYKNEEEANGLYKVIYPHLLSSCRKQGRDSQECIDLLNTLAKAAPFGVKSKNFTKRYIKNKNGWKLLPENPKDIPFGYWW